MVHEKRAVALKKVVDGQSRHGSTPGGSLAAISSVDGVARDTENHRQNAERGGVSRSAPTL